MTDLIWIIVKQVIVWIIDKHFSHHEPLARVISLALPVFDVKYAFTFLHLFLSYLQGKEIS